jgi:hypothetical protein
VSLSLLLAYMLFLVQDRTVIGGPLALRIDGLEDIDFSKGYPGPARHAINAAVEMTGLSQDQRKQLRWFRCGRPSL